jgi:hypothetical protein
MIDSIGGRKVVVAALIVAVAVATVLLKGDIPANFLALLQVVVGAFVAGNVGEHVATAVAERRRSPGNNPDDTPDLDAQLFAANGGVSPAQEIDITPITASIEELKQAQLKSQEAIATSQQTLVALVDIVRKATGLT